MQVQKVLEISEELAKNPDRTPRRPVGVLNHKFIRVLAFLIISMTMLATAAVGVMAVWEVVKPEFAWRGLATLAIVATSTALFVGLNEGFGPIVRD